MPLKRRKIPTFDPNFFSRSKQQVYEDYLNNNLIAGQQWQEFYDEFNRSEIGNVFPGANLPEYEDEKLSTPPVSSDNRLNPENEKHNFGLEALRNWFKSKDVSNFKNGLELNEMQGENNIETYENADEDPIMYGFDFIINTNSSPLFNEVENFITFGDNNNIDEISNRRAIYLDFIEQLKLLFETTDDSSEYKSFKSHYLINVAGLDKLVSKSTGLNEETGFADFGKDEITLTLREDVNLSSGYFTHLYNSLNYNKIQGKHMIPDNLLRFDCHIIISEIRNFRRLVRTDLSRVGDNDSDRYMQVFNDNVSRYIYNLYDCQFKFDGHHHTDSIDRSKRDIEDSFTLKFIYKFSSLEMEKFRYRGPFQGSESRFVSDVNNPLKPINSQNSENITQRPYDVKYKNSEDNLGQGENLPDFENGFLIIDPEDQNIEQGENIDDEETNELIEIAKRTKDYAVDMLRIRRDVLINQSIQRLRTRTNLRRISSPVNVYWTAVPPTAPQFLRDQLRDFTNNRFTNFIGRADENI